MLAQKISNTNCVVDYIPLREIIEVDFEIAPKGGGSRWGKRRLDRSGQGENEEERSPGLFKSAVASIETWLGIDLDGDGISHKQIPPYDKEEEEFHLRIMTDPAGRCARARATHACVHAGAATYTLVLSARKQQENSI